MGNVYLEKIAETLTAQEQAALATGRDRYTVQAGMGLIGGGLAGVAAGSLLGNGAAIGLGAVGGLASAAAMGFKARRNNLALESVNIKDPEAHDTSMVATGRKSYIPSVLAFSTPLGPFLAGETYIHNGMVEAARKRQQLGYEKTAADNRDLDSYAAGYKSPITPTAKTVWQGMGTGAMIGGLSLIPTVKRDLLDGSGIPLERLPKYIADLAIKGKTRVIGGGVAGALAGAAYAHHSYVKPHLAHHQEHEDVSGVDEYRLKHIDKRVPEYAAGAGGLYLGSKHPIPLPAAVTKKITNINPFLGPVAGRLISGAVGSGLAAYGARTAVDHYNGRLLEHIKAKHAQEM